MLLQIPPFCDILIMGFCTLQMFYNPLFDYLYTERIDLLYEAHFRSRQRRRQRSSLQIALQAWLSRHQTRLRRQLSERRQHHIPHLCRGGQGGRCHQCGQTEMSPPQAVYPLHPNLRL